MRAYLRRVNQEHEAIVEAAQLSIPEIFEQFGEPYFRDGERRVIARLIEEGHGVIATGAEPGVSRFQLASAVSPLLRRP